MRPIKVVDDVKKITTPIKLTINPEKGSCGFERPFQNQTTVLQQVAETEKKEIGTNPAKQGKDATGIFPVGFSYEALRPRFLYQNKTPVIQ